jgi:NAD+ kinase
LVRKSWFSNLQLKLRGQAPKALRWKRLESRYKAHKQCVSDLLQYLSNQNAQDNNLSFSCVNRAELDRQHLADVDLVIAVGGDGTVLSSAHFLDHGTIPLLGINSDPHVSKEELMVQKKSDERRSHGALCMCTSVDMASHLDQVLHGGGTLHTRTRIQCKVKSTFSETRLVPALNDLLIANPSPAAVSRFRMGFLKVVPEGSSSAPVPGSDGVYGTITRFGGKTYDVTQSLNVWSSGMWICTATGSTAAMAAAGGQPMDIDAEDLQYLIREHILERQAVEMGVTSDVNNGLIQSGQKLHIRWNSQKGRIFIDGSHLTHNLELGDEVLIDNQAPPLKIFARGDDDPE